MITSIEIKAVEPLADSAPFGAAGAYERVIGVAKGEVDPKAPQNKGIALIDKAPVNAGGKVEYTTDFFILRPKDPAKGNGRILYEVNNRGRKMLIGNLCDGPQGMNDPKTVADLGNAFPLRQGWTIVWSGWDPDAPRANMGLGLTAPVATDHGKPIVQTVRDEFVSGTRGGALEAFKLSYEMANQDGAKLTVRERQADAPQDVAWTAIDAKSIKLADGKPKPGYIYEFTYQATKPKVQGLGFAATRDFVSFLRHAPAGREATGGAITHALAIGFSQAGRYLRHHISEGFNRDEQGRPVFDGIHSHIAGVGRLFFNVPFSQPARTSTQHEDHTAPEAWFPFSTATLEDPLTRQKGSVFRGDGCDPKLIETNTSTEYWQKGASLLTTDPMGMKDVDLPSNTRAYMIAGTQHGGRAGATTDAGHNVNPRNPHNPMPAVRALLVALDNWVAKGLEPPATRTPTLRDGTLVEPDKTGFPSIPGAAVVKVTNLVKPSSGTGAYRTLVSKVDADGNEVAGIRLPDIAVPLAAYTGWNEYKPPYPRGELADRDGSYFAFAPEKISARYGNRAGYVAKVRTTIEQLKNDRLLLQEDADRYIERAQKEERVAP
jgi:Alpha/beta hydrolase domain